MLICKDWLLGLTLLENQGMDGSVYMNWLIWLNFLVKTTICTRYCCAPHRFGSYIFSHSKSIYTLLYPNWGYEDIRF